MAEELNFTEVDPAVLKEECLSQIEAATGELLYPGDERRIFAETLSYAFSVMMNAANEACKKRLLKYASGYVLDALGERVNCGRLVPIPARTRLQFSLSAVRTVDTIVPSGTRCTGDKTILFATDRSVTIPAGELTVEVTSTATIGGTKTNGIPAGVIQTFVDDVPFVSGVVNLSESSGGDDGEPYPQEIDSAQGDDGAGDNHYRERIALAPSSFSTAGPSLGYEYHARSANASIADVSVVSPEPGYISIYVLMSGGQLPSQEVLDEVEQACTREDIKPLGDHVTVAAAEEVEYRIAITCYCRQAEISTARESVSEAVKEYIAWQSAGLGRDINPDKLRSLCLPYCSRLDLLQPGHAFLSKSHVAVCHDEPEISFIEME